MRGIEGSVKFIYGCVLPSCCVWVTQSCDRWSLPSKAMNTYSLQDHFRRDLPWGEKNFTSGISGVLPTSAPLFLLINVCVDRMIKKAQEQGIVEIAGTLTHEFKGIQSIRDIPCFHGDLWETTLPAILQGCEHTNITPDDLLKQTMEEMNKFEDHFMVATLMALPPGQPPQAQEQVCVGQHLTSVNHHSASKLIASDCMPCQNVHELLLQ